MGRVSGVSRWLAIGTTVSTLTLGLVAACSEATPERASPSSVNDAGPPYSTIDDSGVTDADSTAEASPTESSDASDASSIKTPDEILGTLTGSCGIVKTELTLTTPSLERNRLTFVAGEAYVRAGLSADGQRLYDTSNAGGSSGESEVMSFEVLRACEGATLLKTETEITYAPPDDSGPNTITDILVAIDGKNVGVSVTRAYRPKNQSFPDSDVKALIEKKLEGIQRSSVRVLPADRWVKQILHVFAATQDEADAVTRVVPTIDAAIRADTIVLLTQTTGGGFVYCNPDPPLGSECP